jgi:hypothetical protein
MVASSTVLALPLIRDARTSSSAILEHILRRVKKIMQLTNLTEGGNSRKMKSLNIQQFPSDILAKLKAQAALSQITLRELCIAVLSREVSK